MAGDWLKFEKATPDKPEVFAMASTLAIDPDAVVGKLLRVWIWFDTHTTDGNGRGVTLSLLDRISGVSGFAAAMQSVSWLESDSSGVRLPQFDRHTGETAKGRALTAKRVAKHKANGNDKTNAASVTSALPREEKRREEQKQDQKQGSRGARLPADWSPSPGVMSTAIAELGQQAAERELTKFRNHWASAAGANARKVDWSKAFANWCMKAAEWEQGRPRAGPDAPMGKTMQGLQILEGMKNGLAENRNPDGLPEIALPQLGADARR